jgi:apolipoprotein N-acyltransferase
MAITWAFQKNRTWINLSLGAAGTLISLPNHVFSLPLLIFISFIPLFLATRGSTLPKSLFLNFIFLLAVSIGMSFPVDINIILINIYFVLLLLLVFSISSLIHSFTMSVACFSNYNLRPVLLAVGWVAAEYFISSFRISLPLPIAVALAPLPITVQSANIFGGYSISFIIILTNALLAEFSISRSKAIILLIALLHSANLAYGFCSLGGKPALSDGAKIAIIQPNLTIYDYILMGKSKWFENYSQSEMIFLSKESLAKNPTLIVWPELSSNYSLQKDRYLQRLHQEITCQGADLLLGTSYIDHVLNKSKYNIAFILNKYGIATDPYRKIGLFPFAETFFYQAGRDPLPLASESGINDIGTMICLESIYPDIARELTQKGAGALVLISSDSAFGNSMIPYIHENLMALRAIENNRFAVHAGNTGPSAVFDNKGRLKVQTQYGKTADAFARIQGISQISFYNHWGYLFPRICIGVFTIFLCHKLLQLGVENLYNNRTTRMSKSINACPNIKI